MQFRITAIEVSPDEAVSAAEALPGHMSAYVLRPMDAATTLLVAVRNDSGDVSDMSGSDGARDYDARFLPGVDAAVPPAYAQVVSFDGPRTVEHVEAMERADRERLWPAVRDLPGQVGTFVGRGPDGASVVVSLTTSLQAVEDAHTAIAATDLLPGEDPALLTGPDRVQICWVLASSDHQGLFAPAQA